MKTLIFCAGAPNPDLSVLQHTVPDVLVGVDGGAATLAAHGFAPDWAIGDFDTAPPPQTSRRILRLSAEKDDTDLEYALVRVLQDFAPEEVREIIILGALGGGRADHFLCNVWLAHQPRFAAWLDKIRFCERRGSLRFLRAGSHRLYRADTRCRTHAGRREIPAAPPQLCLSPRLGQQRICRRNGTGVV